MRELTISSVLQIVVGITVLVFQTMILKRLAVSP